VVREAAMAVIVLLVAVARWLVVMLAPGRLKRLVVGRVAVMVALVVTSW